MQHYHKEWSGTFKRFKRVAGLSDGCSGQFKSRFAAYKMTYNCERSNFVKYIHNYAPTGNFKCYCDSYVRGEEGGRW